MFVVNLVDGTVQEILSGTFVQFTAAETKACAFIKPKPNLLLNHNPPAFFCQPGLSDMGASSDVQIIKCWTSLQDKFGL